MYLERDNVSRGSIQVPCRSFSEGRLLIFDLHADRKAPKLLTGGFPEITSLKDFQPGVFLSKKEELNGTLRQIRAFGKIMIARKRGSVKEKLVKNC